MSKKKSKKRYVIGRQKEGSCSLVANIAGETTDDQNLEAARSFTSFVDAMQVALERDVGVFEVVGEEWPAKLQEIKFDLETIINRVTGNTGCHSLRKTYCQKIYLALGCDLIATQAAMHHSAITSTIRYLSFDTKKVDAAILSI